MVIGLLANSRTCPWQSPSIMAGNEATWTQLSKLSLPSGCVLPGKRQMESFVTNCTVSILGHVSCAKPDFPKARLHDCTSCASSVQQSGFHSSGDLLLFGQPQG
eukprot:TRINITY_DN34103_c0_g1_i1.p2 TRINITY_DN34103_c0_g1~~TRINITY_DN34103_c0_g1_i1.p2  ORF type:complete len:104 (+),score=11.13 TRINITY_DN34103_c0_g1_i1:933-1244(+)